MRLFWDSQRHGTYMRPDTLARKEQEQAARDASRREASERRGRAIADRIRRENFEAAWAWASGWTQRAKAGFELDRALAAGDRALVAGGDDDGR